MEFVCSHFQFGMLGLKSYQGLVLADQDRFLLVPNINANLLSAGMLGGAAGVALASALGAAGGQAQTGARETTMEELSPEDRQAIRQVAHTVHRSWAKLFEKPGVRVIILPRAAIQAVTLSMWTSGTLQTDMGRIKLLVPLVQFRGARRALEKYGWIAAKKSV